VSQHRLVGSLVGALPGPAGALGAATALPELVTLVGFVDGNIVNPGTGTNWVLVYRDWRMTGWWLVEGAGIIHYDRVPDDGTDPQARQVLWVNRDTAVGRGSGPQSDEARFLTGQFVRAGDFDRWETGGPSSVPTRRCATAAPRGRAERLSPPGPRTAGVRGR
jgi:hypothetical protein